MNNLFPKALLCCLFTKVDQTINGTHELPKLCHLSLVLALFLFGFIGNAQVMQLEVIGGSVVTQGSTVTINAGNSLDFRITNIETNNCSNLKIEDVDIANTTDFDINPGNPKKNIKPEDCPGGKKLLDFEIENLNLTCSTTSTLVTIEIKNQSDFTFTLEVNSSPVISVLGGSPLADISNGDTTTSSINGTYFGVIAEGASVSRNFIITNTGSCPLDITSITSSLSDFAVAPYVLLPDYTPAFLTESINPGSFIIFIVTFTGPVGGSGTLTSTISVSNSDNTTFTFDVSAEMFDFDIPGPGGITADFRLWLKSTRGITESAGKVSLWEDLGSNGKDASQGTAANQPTFLDTAASNINFNPVIKFVNDGATVEEYLENTSNGFYSQDIFIVMIPDATMTNTSSRNTIFSGIATGLPGDITGVGFGDYSTEFTNETLSYNQDVAAAGAFNGYAELNSSYSNAGIINIRNNDPTLPTGQDIIYNSSVLTTSSVDDIPFINVGYLDTVPDPDVIMGTQYLIGKNFDLQGNLNGRVAEIFTFAERVPDADRQKIESYLAIKYGITLGSSNEAQKDYINSFGTSIWDISAHTGYNYHVAGIGRDSISDLNQKQSRTINLINEVTLGLNGIFSTNSANTNEFQKDGDFLTWGSNNAAYTASGSNTITISTGVTTSLTRISRQWKIIESTEASSDVGNVFVSIPSAAFSGFSKTADEEYVLIVADNDNFANGDIIDVIPLKSDGGSNLQTWYDFDGTKYFTFGKAPKLSGNRSVSISAGDYLVGEYALNLNIDAFTISAWIKSASSANVRTIMAKGSKLQLRLNASDQIEVMVDDDVTPRFTSSMVVNDGKWHQVTFVYKSGTIFLYIDGVLDRSEQNVEAPTPNYNRFSLGALFIDKNSIINPFLGEIDEVYVWDQGLTHDQVKYLMNQEIERYDNTGTDYVTGKILPQVSASNEVASIPWSNLKAYYDFNSFYGSTIEGLTDDRNFLRLKYLNKDKTIAETQSIPAPYITAADGAWDAASTWSNNADQVIPNSLSLDGTTIIDWNIVETSHNITSGDRDIVLLGLKNNSGTITIADPTDPQDETNSGQGLTVTHYMEIDGVIDLIGESQLVQSEGSIIDADSGGYIERDQQGTSNGFNYNYWSSSVGPITGNTLTRGTGISNTNSSYSVSGFLNDGTSSAAYQNLTFSPSYTAADSNTPTNPRTVSSYWFYKFYGASDDYNAWNSIDENTSLQPGEGFTMKGTSGATDILLDFQNYVFKGIPFNGDITVPLDNSSGNVDRLIGNPYPSAIDATEFILDNLSIADGGTNPNGTIFNGAVYFWNHFGEQNSHILGDYVGGYATRNLTGGAVAISNDILINNTSDNGNPAVGLTVPGPYIPVNQGFFVSTTLDGFNNDDGVPISTVDGGDVVFKNSQRVFVREDASNSIFMSANEVTGDFPFRNNISEEIIDNTPTIRLTYDSPKGYHRQIVLGKKPEATNGFDLGYDAFIADINEEDMYWIIDDNNFVIQGVNNFDVTQEFPLGLIVNESGTIKIGIDALEHVDPNLKLYIKDELTGAIQNILNSPFEIQLEPDEYNSRFTLVFQLGVVLTVDDVINNDYVIYYDTQASSIQINLQQNNRALNMSLYNSIGQRIIELDSIDENSERISIPVQVNPGIYIVKVNTAFGLLNKKLIIGP
ncbi:MAG: T9SS type A sorting domain-containing protein [Bacteroidia bacterium]|nr:T9SS type A sorting domain-containing protein [Bacteroidia bacterium]NNL32459.1 T9SS type A sorting domain-containing protein [Flavobacteriaceae bacterium]